MIYCEGYHSSILKVYKNLVVIVTIYMRIQEMFNVTDGWDRNVGVDFLLLFFHFYLKSLDSPNIFHYIYKSHKYASIPDTWNFKPSSSFIERCENAPVMDGHLGKKCHFRQHTLWKNSLGQIIFVPWNFLKNLIATVWGSFHGGASPSYDLSFNVTDRQNANP